MTALPAPGTPLKALSDLPDPGGAAADWTGAPILILRRGGSVYAYRTSAPLRTGP